MAKLDWGNPKDRLYEYGVDRGVFAINNGAQVYPWSGLTAVNSTTEIKEPTPTYLDGVKIINNMRGSDYEGSIEAFYSPPEFDMCDGTYEEFDGIFSSGNPPKKFDFSYRSLVGSDDYKIHLIYNCLASPSDRNTSTVTDQFEPEPLSWAVTTNPSIRSGGKRTHFSVDTTKTSIVIVRAIESLLYGSEANSPIFPTYNDLVAAWQQLRDVVVTDYGDGTWSIEGPSDVVRLVDSDRGIFEINWVGVDNITSSIFSVRD